MPFLLFSILLTVSHVIEPLSLNFSLPSLSLFSLTSLFIIRPSLPNFPSPYLAFISNTKKRVRSKGALI